jgi:hypothetical protein
LLYRYISKEHTHVDPVACNHQPDSWGILDPVNGPPIS